MNKTLQDVSLLTVIEDLKKENEQLKETNEDLEIGYISANARARDTQKELNNLKKDVSRFIEIIGEGTILSIYGGTLTEFKSLKRKLENIK